MNPVTGIALFVGIYGAAHLYGCRMCRVRFGDWRDNVEDFARSIGRRR